MQNHVLVKTAFRDVLSVEYYVVDILQYSGIGKSKRVVSGFSPTSKCKDPIEQECWGSGPTRGHAGVPDQETSGKIV